MGGEPAHRTNPQPGGPGYSVRVISLSLWCPHTTLARQQDLQPYTGALTGCYQPEPAEPWFFFAVVTPPPPPFSTGLGTGYGGVPDVIMVPNVAPYGAFF
jgi:hypothetical protein